MAEAKKVKEVVKELTQEEKDAALISKSSVGGEGGKGQLASVKYDSDRMPGKVA